MHQTTPLATVTQALKVLVWDENPDHVPAEVYPLGLRETLAAGFKRQAGPNWQVLTGHLDQPDQGLPAALLESLDVLVWWAHKRHAEVSDQLAEAICQQVHVRGLGLIVLHSAHYAKPFQRVLGATGHLKGGWREDGQPELITVAAPQHPIARGIVDFELAAEEMYGAPFEVPPPECLVFQSYFPAGGEFFPSGLTWTVGQGIAPNFTSGPGGGQGQGKGCGRVFYFRPGHESHPSYLHPYVQQILINAVLWAAHHA